MLVAHNARLHAPALSHFANGQVSIPPGPCSSQEALAVLIVMTMPDAEGLTKTKAFVVLKEAAKTTDAELKAFEGLAGALQISPHNSVCVRAAEDSDRKNSTVQAKGTTLSLEREYVKAAFPFESRIDVLI